MKEKILKYTKSCFGESISFTIQWVSPLVFVAIRNKKLWMAKGAVKIFPSSLIIIICKPKVET